MQGGQPERPVLVPSPWSRMRRCAIAPGGGFLLRQLPALGVVGGLGADHLEQPLAQLAQRRRVELRREVEHVHLGPLPGPGREVVVLAGERLHRGGHHPRLLGIDRPARPAPAGGVERLVELPAQVQVRERSRPAGLASRAPATPASRSPPSPHPRRRGRPAPAPADSSSLQPGPARAQLHQRLTLLVRGHRPHRHPSQPIQGARQRRREPHHRMRLRDTTRRRCRRNQRQGHAPTLEARHPHRPNTNADRGQPALRRGCGRKPAHGAVHRVTTAGGLRERRQPWDTHVSAARQPKPLEAGRETPRTARQRRAVRRCRRGSTTSRTLPLTSPVRSGTGAGNRSDWCNPGMVFVTDRVPALDSLSGAGARPIAAAHGRARFARAPCAP